MHAVWRVTKQLYYQYDERLVLACLVREAFAVEYIKAARAKVPVGGRKRWHMYCLDFTGNHHPGRDRFEALIGQMRLKLRRHGLPVYPDLTRNFIPDGPNQLWAGDITHIPAWQDANRCTFCYLSMILDCYSEELIGFDVSARLDARGSVRTALCEALRCYNNERPHMSVDMLTPAEASACKGERSKR